MRSSNSETRTMVICEARENESRTIMALTYTRDHYRQNPIEITGCNPINPLQCALGSLQPSGLRDCCQRVRCRARNLVAGEKCGLAANLLITQPYSTPKSLFEGFPKMGGPQYHHGFPQQRSPMLHDFVVNQCNNSIQFWHKFQVLHGFGMFFFR